jgi:hypothetical protein
MRVLVFLQGTVIMHRAAVGRTREERVAQSREGDDPTLSDYADYLPIGNAVLKLRLWEEQGAEIQYLSSHRDPDDLAADVSVLERYGFPHGRVVAREPGESYGDVVGRVLPDILVEDDCESIGGAAQQTYPQIAAELRQRITSIVVPEFGGIDDLPASPELLGR